MLDRGRILHALRPWLIWLGVVLALAGVYRGFWPAAWAWVVEPSLEGDRPGLRIAYYSGENRRGQLLRDDPIPSADFSLPDPHTSAHALGAWRVERAGVYRFRLEVDDYGHLWIDRKEVVALHGAVKAANAGLGQIYLEPGEHLIELELNNRPGQGWLRLRVQAPGSPRFLPLDPDALHPLGGSAAGWIAAADITERLALVGLLGAWISLFLLLALPGRETPAWDPPPRRTMQALFLAAMVAAAAIGAWYSVERHRHYLHAISGHDYLIEEQWTEHQDTIAAAGQSRDHRHYRVLPHWALWSFRQLLSGTRSDPSPQAMLFWLRWAADFLILALAALFYRRLGITRAGAALGVCLLTWALYDMRLRSGLAHATFYDAAFFLLGGLAVVQRRALMVLPITALGVLNKETALLIPVLPLAAAMPRLWPPRLPRRELLIALAGLGLGLAVFLGLRLVLGWSGGAKPHDRPGWHFILHNLNDPDTLRHTFYVLGLVPIIALATMRRSPRVLQRLFWAVVPVWFVVHSLIAWWAEPRIFAPPLALCFLPMALLGAGAKDPLAPSPPGEP